MLAEQLQRFLSKHIPGYLNKKYVLAVSGGMDSMLLLHLFKSENMDIVVAHCNFNLRGDESDADEEFVKQQCGILNVPYYVRHFDTIKEKNTQHEGIQLVARNLRYTWFEKLRKELKFDYICTAHHQRDNAETIVQRFMLGAYPESLQGIKPLNDAVLRPMLYMHYKDLVAHAEQNNILFRTDSSNLSLNYTRNKIRQFVLPALKDVFGDNYLDKIEGIAENYSSYFSFIKQQAENLLHRKNTWHEINIETLKQTKGNVSLLYEAIKNQGFNWDQCKDICANLTREQGTVYESDDRRFNLFFANGVLQLVPVLEDDFYADIVLDEDIVKVIDLPGSKLSIYHIKREELPEFSRGILYVDYDLIQHKKISIRTWKNGDLFTPLGMSGKKSVADFLKDMKLSPAEKQYQHLLCVEEEIVCVLGRRIDDRFKITEATGMVLVLELSRI